jgi:hypothetical protein
VAPGQDTRLVERCAAGEGRRARTAPPDSGGELKPHCQIREVGSIHAARVGSVARTTSPERERCTIGEGRGPRTTLPERGGEIELHRQIGEVGSIHTERGGEIEACSGRK